MGRVAGCLSIVFPMWNEESSIHLAVDAAREAVDALTAAGDIDTYELVIVDDASTDATPAMADALAANDDHIRVVHHETNKGLGGSVKTGLATATGDLVLYTDADLPCDLLESLTRAVRLMRIYGADIVSAYRHDRTAEGPRRAVYTFAYNSLIRVGFGLRVRDVNFAFKLVRRPVLDRVSVTSEGSFVDAEFLIRAHRLGFHIIQFGVDYFPRTRGVSTLSSTATIAKILQEMATLRPELAGLTPATGPGAAPPGPSRRRRQRHATPPPATEQKLLIVNADDYGLTEQVARGILRAHREGVVTSTSALVLAPGFATSGKWLLEEERLGVGVHLAAVGEDPPLLSGREVPTLVDRRGRLAANWKVFLARAAARRIDPADVEREFAAQLEAVRDIGIHVTHLDTHQHLHLWPLVRDVVIRLAAAGGVPAIRVPRSTSAFPGTGVNHLARALARAAATAGLVFPGDAAGIDEAGRLGLDRAERALTRLAASGATAVELSAHPGGPDDPERGRYQWGYAWEGELATLVAPALRAAIDRHGFVLGSYRDLVTASRPPS